MNIQLESEYFHVFPNNIYSALTPVADKLGRPYVYVATHELGLRIYETEPTLTPVATLDTNDLFMRVSSVTQRDTLLYVCLGSIFAGSTDPPGIVIVNVADPVNPVVLDEWIAAGNGSGTGVVKIQGDHAYVGGMGEGLIILNISDPNNITFVSQVTPAIDYPHMNNTPATVNARGMALVNDTLVYLCYDAGAMRVINCADINNPVQIQEFSNPVTDNTGPPFYWNVPRAYNHVAVEDTIAYVAVDYCGLEVWGISDPYNANLLTHWNPHDCPTGQWTTASIHTNEIFPVFECDLLFISTGGSDMMVLDIANPYAPVAVDSFGTETDMYGTWGVDGTDEFLYLTYMNPPLNIPFPGNHPGLRKLSYDKCAASVGAQEEEVAVKLFPNPSNGKVTLEVSGIFTYVFLDASGKQMFYGGGNQSSDIDISQLDAGIYFVKVQANARFAVKQLIVR